ncbi:hypothetical protein QTI66_20910 [Variovorax sp. J22R133]|uniref:hypothetical protein n=1 Tax=Variovorax brevis TaxID=3053503 RepID=UPI002577A50C|nr:hypothetical protein [Variovorax sp. J22R133]MDM0114625.1 hypothetical protein [Variovorax sp. J22R133]
MHFESIFRLLALIVIFTMAMIANAACRLPAPDGGVTNPSPPNLVGTITASKISTITLKTSSGQIKRVRPPQSGVYYTAFGGDDKINSLRKGLVARVWFVDCRASTEGVLPTAKYLEVYSNDPLDRPPADYWQ